MISDALLAMPLYGNDYATATWRDIYLPAGEWMDFDTGKLYSGGQMLQRFELPLARRRCLWGARAEVNGLPAGTPWAGVVVQDGEGHSIATQRLKHAFTFTCISFARPRLSCASRPSTD